METAIQHDQKLLDRAEAFVKRIFEEKVASTFVYHTIEHTLRVRDVSRILATNAGLSWNEIEILELSALFHDTGFSRALQNHESHSKKIAEEFLVKAGYPTPKIRRVLTCIEATKIDWDPVNKLEEIIKDADMSSLGSKDYFEEAEKLREELNTVQNEGLESGAWDQINLAFLKEHKYFTPEAQKLFDKRKKKNVKKLERQLGLIEEKPSLITIGTSKSAQTQFKTALRNHIDLSAIADNKANIMLSVNALIITIALPFLGNSIVTNPALLTPTIILLFVCVTSIVFATLATRPIKMSGSANKDDIVKKKSNLFFFGNFYKMNFGDYEDGMRSVVSDDAILDNSIMRDLFFLGKALGKKYHYLRLCYNIFMFGIILTVIAFIFAYVIMAQGGQG